MEVQAGRSEMPMPISAVRGKMTQDEIRTEFHRRRDKIRDLRADFEGAVGIERAHLNALEQKCRHPNGYQTSCMGETGYHCPDCGYSR